MNVRKRFIIDCVDYYKHHHSEDYINFVKQVKERREGLKDKELGHLRGESEIRLAVSLPSKLYDMMALVFKDEEKKFLDDKGEMKWFANKYKEFLIPNNY